MTKTSCGHDAHMAMVLGAAYILKSMNRLPNGTIRFIFQPAEEKGSGALKMVEEGVVDDVDFLYGVHLRPKQELEMGRATPAILHGAARFMEGEIIGEDLHGARPHLGANAIEVGATIVNMLNGIHLDSKIPHSVKMTSFHAGSKSHNIIPGNATFGLDLRAQTNETMDELVEQINKQINALQEIYNVTINLETTAKIVAAVVDEEAEKMMSDAIDEVIGSENLESPLVTTGGDDFHFYTIQRPHLKATMLGLGCNLSPGLHHPHMTFDHKALLDGALILAKVLHLTLKKRSEA